MGDQIEFPKNYGTYMHHAMKALQSGNYEQAIDYLEKAYAIKEENSLNVLLVSALFHNGQVKEAMDLAEDKKDFYISNDKRVLVYVELLIHNQQFLLAKKFIDDKLKEPSGPFVDNWKTLQETLRNKQEEEEQKRKILEEKRMKKLFSLASTLPEEQFGIVQEAHSMKTVNLEKAASSVFQNPYIHPIARSGYLSLLISRNVDREFSYTWFEQTKHINPIEMRSFEDDPVVKELLSQTDEMYDQDPSLNELVKNELNMILLLLYPFIDEVIEEKDITNWIRTIAHTINPTEETLESINDNRLESIQSWINKIHQEFQ